MSNSAFKKVYDWVFILAPCSRVSSSSRISFLFWYIFAVIPPILEVACRNSVVKCLHTKGIVERWQRVATSHAASILEENVFGHKVQFLEIWQYLTLKNGNFQRWI